MQNNLQMLEAFKYGWAKMRTHSTIIFQSLMTLFALEIAGQVVSHTIGRTLEGALATVVLALATLVVGIGFTNIALKLVKGEHAQYGDLMPGATLCIAYLAASLLSGLVTVVPIVIALIISLVLVTITHSIAVAVVVVPVMAVGAICAVYLGLRYTFVRFAILEDPNNITDSLRVSAKLTEGRKWWLLGFTILMVVFNIIGAILLLIGLLITIPVTLLAYAHVYRTLRAHHS